ncbi:MFS transporter [Roseateles aquatilis]|nr:MFS transporter [Roseateles aquatilis]
MILDRHRPLIRPVSFVLAQGLSGLGAAATSFAIDVWVFQQTGSYTIFATLALMAALPALLLSPFSGALVDRLPKRRVLVSCDAASLLVVAAALLAVALDSFSVTGAAAVMVLLSSIQTVRWPALTSTVTLITPGPHLARISGLEEAVQATSTVAAPIVGAALFHLAGLSPILLLNVVSFVCSIAIVLSIQLPAPPASAGQTSVLRAVFGDPAFGMRWIWARKHLLRLLVFIAVLNLGCATFVTVNAPLVLSFADAGTLGLVMATGSGGLVLGGVLMTATGGIKPFERGVLLGASGIACGVLVFGLAQTLPWFALGTFLFGFMHPVVNAAAQVLWRTETPVEIQGRVFAIRRMISWGLNPFAIAMSIPLSTWVFGGLLDALNSHLPRIGAWWGTGQAGRLGLMLSTMGLGMLLVIATATRTGFLARAGSSPVGAPTPPHPARGPGPTTP